MALGNGCKVHSCVWIHIPCGIGQWIPMCILVCGYTYSVALGKYAKVHSYGAFLCVDTQSLWHWVMDTMMRSCVWIHVATTIQE